MTTFIAPPLRRKLPPVSYESSATGTMEFVGGTVHLEPTITAGTPCSSDESRGLPAH